MRSQSVPLDEYKRNMEGLVKLGRDKGCRVIVLTPPPVCEDKRLAFQQNKHGESSSLSPPAACAVVCRLAGCAAAGG